ncbi:MAG: T9SS type A sorting domain-containing protein [Balneolaceae bacterium]|nr:T9SS type A sorting domain-containing protein [Balneolaceae bacterium]MBO6547615.1 T9SS type A sorting domain-containing protein [Balneolaceae bacterium]MBO6648126.1 T9SS type A sorting domain-containing protein [Balneolaceae bacterium]
MQLSRTLLALLFATISFSTLTHAQLFEDFETGTKGSYSGATVTLATGDWFLDDALLGNLSNDKFNGDQGVRMDRRDGKTGNIYMQFDKPNGADEVSFHLAHYGNQPEAAALQVQYSTDGGSNWIDIGDEIPAPFELTEYSIPVQVDGNIRFKFVQSSGTDRMNIDDIRITDFIEPQEEPGILVEINEELVDSGATITFETTLTGNTRDKQVQLKNIGSDTLRISNIIPPTAPFTVSELQDSVLAFNETTMVTLSFTPQSEGSFTNEGGFEIQSNTGVFKASLSGEAVEAGGVIPISTARDLPQGETVTLTGWVTVAEEFEGPVYFQDETGGIAWFNFGLMRDSQDGFTLDVQRGDSIVITGELGSFNDLIQIVGDDVQYEFFPDGNREIEPLPVTVSALNSGSYEGQLVSMNVEIDHSGVFQSSEYDITDATGSGVLYINDDTEIVGATAPEGETTIVGVVGIFSGTYQLLPRDLEDIDAEAIEIPGEDISKDETFEIVTWNIEWFGSAGNGPEDDEIQLMNVIEVIDSIDADVFALQEIANQTMFNRLIDSLEIYEGVLASFSQSQKTAYLYKTSTINVLDSGLLTTGQESFDWANGRFPLELNFEAVVGQEVREIRAYNIHAKALGEQEDYVRRRDASISLKNYLDQNEDNSNVIVIGDYNDELEASSVGGQDSPYKNFVDDEEYTVLTKSLEDRGFTSYSSFSMIDHITISSELVDEYFEGTERVENPSYIGSYLSQTSDHYPVWVRFQWGMATSTEEPNTTVTGIRLDQNYPNPFNPSTTISYSLDATTNVTLEVFDMMGRKVSTLVQGRQIAGEQTINFDASALASGVYIYRLATGGEVLTKKMILLK